MQSISGIVEAPSEAIVFATTDVADFLCEEGDVLQGLLELFDQIEAADAVPDLRMLCREERPYVRGITISLDIVLEALEQSTSGSFEESEEVDLDSRDIQAAFLWYRAKVFDLLTGFRR